MSHPDPIAEHASHVMERYQRPLVQYAMQITQDLETAKDVVQDVLIKLITRHQEILTGETSHLEGWLFRSCRNRAIDYTRKSSKIVHLDPEMQRKENHPDANPLEQLLTNDRSAQIVELMGELPLPQQEVLRLKFAHDLPYREIAEITGNSISNVGFLIHKGLQALREKLTRADASDLSAFGGEA